MAAIIENQSVQICQFRDSTSDYYDQLINLAEDYLDKTDEPTVTGFNNYIIHNN